MDLLQLMTVLSVIYLLVRGGWGVRIGPFADGIGFVLAVVLIVLVVLRYA